MSELHPGTRKYPYLLSYPSRIGVITLLRISTVVQKSISRSITSHLFQGIKNCWVIPLEHRGGSNTRYFHRGNIFSFVHWGILQHGWASYHTKEQSIIGAICRIGGASITHFVSVFWLRRASVLSSIVCLEGSNMFADPLPHISSLLRTVFARRHNNERKSRHKMTRLEFSTHYLLHLMAHVIIPSSSMSLSLSPSTSIFQIATSYPEPEGKPFTTYHLRRCTGIFYFLVALLRSQQERYESGPKR